MESFLKKEEPRPFYNDKGTSIECISFCFTVFAKEDEGET